ncbi:hypothetical protein BDW71DRAFT_210718 [Aspergillus fruticulosus]
MTSPDGAAHFLLASINNRPIPEFMRAVYPSRLCLLQKVDFLVILPTYSDRVQPDEDEADCERNHRVLTNSIQQLFTFLSVSPYTGQMDLTLTIRARSPSDRMEHALRYSKSYLQILHSPESLTMLYLSFASTGLHHWGKKHRGSSDGCPDVSPLQPPQSAGPVSWLALFVT